MRLLDDVDYDALPEAATFPAIGHHRAARGDWPAHELVTFHGPTARGG